MITIKNITDTNSLQKAFQIRKEVFVVEQNVPEEEEYDEFEESARHFLAFFYDTPCGTARWRFTENGVKLERFAVLKDFRGKGVGHGLVQALLRDMKEHPDFRTQPVYLHAQVSAMLLYSKSGFKAEGEMFQECDIDHYKMILDSGQ